jgi:hypothetical protein
MTSLMGTHARQGPGVAPCMPNLFSPQVLILDMGSLFELN